MEILAAWFLFSVIIGVWAGARGRWGFGWFMLAVITSPLVAALFLVVSANLNVVDQPQLAAPTPETHVICPDCAEFVRIEASICKHCRAKLVPAVEAVIPVGGEPPLSKKKIIGIAILLLVLYFVFINASPP